MRAAVLVVLMLGLAFGASAAELRPGTDYRVLERPQPTGAEGRVQVTEFFSYGCPHCFNFMPMMDSWSERAGADVDVRRIPVTVGRDQWRHLAKAYYVAELLGAVETMHPALFEAMHVQNRRFRNAEDLVAFFAEHGHDPAQVREAFGSFAVDVKVRQADKLVRNYQIRSTPSVAVAGRYVMDPSMVGSQERMLDIMSELVRQEGGTVAAGG